MDLVEKLYATCPCSDLLHYYLGNQTLLQAVL